MDDDDTSRSLALPLHRLAGGEIDEMDSRAGGTAERLEAPPLEFRLLFQMSLDVHARLGALENDEIRHRRKLPQRHFPALI
ncbi:hypothetical protein [Bradyrhizobium sp. Cp5.3]|uniref:hypothetical protein n=1 Tax=Bradyrhizobium sp. Cp5.3 TaxID=443598 RepID=UPI0018DDC0F4|nr:hypothetical protein [Bradyrhizobium sp. Cp5.3]